MTDIVFWTCEDDAEFLEHEDIDEAVGAYLGELDADPETVTVYGYRRMAVTTRHDPLAPLLEALDDEYGSTDGDDTMPTDGMREAAARFVRYVCENYTPWACERCEEVEVNVAQWRKENGEVVE